MSIELDGINLIRHIRDTDTGATTLLHTVYNIDVGEKRSIVEHQIPGLEGAVLQDLGRESVRISFEGLIFGEEALQFLERIQSKYTGGEAVPFNSDISNIAEVTQVLIEELEVEVQGARTYWYWMVIREYIPPPEEAAAPSQEDEAEEAMQEQADDDLASKNYITGKVVDDEGNPQVGVNVKIVFDGGEYTVQTDEAGVYRKDGLDPGRYTITIDAPEYEGIKREVEVKLE